MRMILLIITLFPSEMVTGLEKLDEKTFLIEFKGCPQNYCPRAWHKYNPTLFEYINLKYNGMDFNSELE